MVNEVPADERKMVNEVPVDESKVGNEVTVDVSNMLYRAQTTNESNEYNG